MHLSAVHSGAHVMIQVRDDGAGLDREVIRLKAMEKGLIPPDSVLSEKDIFSLILAPALPPQGMLPACRAAASEWMW